MTVSARANCCTDKIFCARDPGQASADRILGSADENEMMLRLAIDEKSPPQSPWRS
jgi:hypothetical protein